MSTESNYGSSGSSADDRDRDRDVDVDIMPLGEALSMELLNQSQLDSHERSIGESPVAASLFESSTRPTGDGSCLLAAPSGLLSSSVYRLSSPDGGGGGRIIEALQISSSSSARAGVEEDEDAVTASSVVEVVARSPLSSSSSSEDQVSGVFITISDDGRMIGVACSDGSLRCYDVTASSSSSTSTTPVISHRWTVVDAHSHILDSTGKIVIPTDRNRRSNNAAADAGPVRSLEFSPSSKGGGHLLLLVDSSRGTLSMYDAASPEPTDILSSSSIDGLRDGTISCACWCRRPSDDDQLALAVGRVDSSIRIYSLDHAGDVTVRRIATLDTPDLPLEDEDEEGNAGNWCCTHLDWLDGHRDLAAGFCRVTFEGDLDDDPDDEDEDDPARHEVSFFVGTLAFTDNTGDSFDVKVEWSEDFGEMLCPFFSVPRGGRHVYFTSYVPTASKYNETSATTPGLLLVASNLSSDVGVLALLGGDVDGGNGWEYLDLEEGRNATTPTDEEDEYTYPTGLVVSCRGAAAGSVSPSAVALLGSTDGSASVFSPNIEGSPNVFAIGGDEGPTLQPLPVEMTAASPAAVAAAAAAAPSRSEEEAPAPAPATTTTTPAAPRQFGVVPASSSVPATFGAAPAPAPAPASTTTGSTSSLMFGSAPTTATTTFGGSSTSATAPTTFGATGGFGGGGGGGGGGGFTFGTGGADGGGFSFGGGGGGTGGGTGTGDAPSSSSASSTTTGAATSTTASSSIFGSGFGTPGKKPPVPFGSCFGSSSTSTSGAGGGSSGGFAALAAAAAAGTPTTPEATSEAASALSPPPFGAFVKDGLPPQQLSQRMAPGMVKPLFSTCGGCGTSTEGKTPSSEPQSPAEGGEGIGRTTEPKPERKREPAPSTPAAQRPTSKAAQRAGEVFDSFDVDRVGTLPASRFEDLVDDIGEGFHGDELERQLRSVLDGGSGGDKDAVIDRDAFVRWYVDLVEGGGGPLGDDDGSSSSSDGSSVAEERAEAEEKFRAIAGDDGPTISPDDFPKLMESMGTTYCEEEHSKTLKKITGVDGRITRDAFVDWYVDWIFGDDEDEDEGYDEDGDGEAGGGARDGGTAADQGWGGCFSSSANAEEGSWRCECCMVQNKPGTNVCAACETPRPGCSDGGDGEGGGAPPSTATGAGPTTTSSGIGSGGFTFGGGAATTAATTSSSGIGSGGFTFGGAAAAAPSSSSSSSGVGSGGFTFGGGDATTPAPGAASTSKSTGIGSGGFTFGGAGAGAGAGEGGTATGGIGAGGFTFGGGTTSTTGASAPRSAPAGTSGGGATTTSGSGTTATTTTTTATTKPASATPPPAKKEPSDAALRAMRVFDDMDESNTGKLDVSCFEDLLDELGEGFHGEELERQLSLVVGLGGEDGTIKRKSFVSWYVNLVDDGKEKGDDGGSSSSSLDTDEREEREEEAANAMEAFDNIATEGMDSIPVSEFGKLMESMGTTYCEEEHRRTIKKISSPGGGGRISRDAFVNWYVQWVFDEEESDAGSSSRGEGEEEVTPATTGAAAGGEGGGGGGGTSSSGWGPCFGRDEEGSWKCDTCMVLNKPGTKICAACESPRPGHEEDVEGVTGTKKDDSAVASSGIGSGGFMFGGIATTPGEGLSDDKTGASAPAQAPAPAAASIGPGGFTFGTGTAAVAKQITEAPKQKPVGDSTTLSTEASSAPSAPSGGGKMAPSSTPAARSASTGTSSAYPPMSTKAPLPVSGFMSKTASQASSAAPAAAKPAGSSAGYPPMGVKAPTPFSVARKVTTAASSSSSSSDKKPTSSAVGSYPPMSKKAPSPSPFSAPAPSPFSALGSQKTASSSTAPASAPPQSAVLGGFQQMAPSSSSSDRPKSASAYPPMSMKAPSPSPFSGFGANAASSSTAPAPAPAPAAPKPAGGSAAFPPMASTAPTPFGGTKATAPSSTSSNKAVSSFGFPTASTKAPSPFSGFGGSKAASASASAAPAGPKTGDASGGYPPMSAKTPTPFSRATATSSSTSTTSSGAFLSMPGKAPLPFSGVGAKTGSATPATAAPKQVDAAPTSFAGVKVTASVSKTPSGVEPPKPTSAGTGSSTSTSAVRQPPQFKASSPYEAQVYNALTGIDSSLSSLRRQRMKVESSSRSIDSNADGPEFQNMLQSLVEDSQKINGSVATAEESINAVNQRSVFLLSQRDDVERQVKESGRLLDEQRRPGTTDGAVSSYSQIIQKQPLDMESEKQRRRLASMSVHVQRGLVDLRERVRMSQRIFHLVKAADEDDRHIANCVDKVRDVRHDDRSSPSHQIGGSETLQANKALFFALKTGYDRAKEFETTVDKMETQVKELSKLTPFAENPNKQGAVVSLTRPGKSKSSRGGEKGPRIAPRGSSIAITARPLNLPSTLPSFRRSAADDTSDRLSRIESEVRKIASAPDYVQVKKFARSSPVLPGNPKRLDERQSARQWRQGASSQLMNTPDTIREPRGGSGARGISTPSYQPTAQALFRSPSTEPDSRYGYRSPRSIDRGKGDQLVASIPAGLREINASDAARKALASYGTTPERVSQARDTVARGVQLPSKQSPQVSSEKGSVKKEAIGKKTASSVAFPPMSTKAPTPFAALDKGAAKKSAVPTALPALPAKPPVPFSHKDSKLAAPVAESPLYSQDSKTGVESPAKAKADTKASIGKTQSTPDVAGVNSAKEKSLLGAASSSTAGFSFGDVSALGDALTAVQKPPLKEIGGGKTNILSSKDGGASLISTKPSLGRSGSFLSPPTTEFGTDSAPQASASVQDVSQPDYRSMLVSFYGRHNPAKVGDVDRNLEKYKGKEAEMFERLATKYNVPNPLQKGGKPPPSPAPAPVQTSPFAPVGSSVQLSAQKDQPDYRSLLVSFYQKYNPTKVGDVEGTLIKYKGKETEMFAKLANKYKVPNPLMTGGAVSGQAPSTTPSQGSPFLAATPASPTPFGAAPSPSPTPFGSKPPSPGSIPFGAKPPLASSPSPFGSNTSIAQAAAPSSPFGAAAGTAATFGSSSTNQSPFASSFGQGSATPPSLPFGASTGSSMTSASPFSSAATTTGAAFGSATSPSPFVAAPVAPSDPSRFGGRNPRDILTSFYQQYNASKVADVDKLLAKYAGKEEQLFRNLAKKYSLDEKMFGISPAAPVSSVGASFASAQPNAAQQPTFGGAGLGFGARLAPSPSPFSSPSPGGFGQPSSLGGNSAPAVGSTISSSPFGASASSGQTMGFGSLAANSGPGTTSSFSSAAAAFGGGNANSSGGFGSGSTGFGGASPSAGFSSFGATGGFGGPTPFGGARR